MAYPITVLGSTVLWPTTGDTGYSANALQLQQLFATAVLPIADLYNTTTGLVGNLGYSNSNQLTLNGVPVASGSVTSVGISGANGIGVASSPITSSGTIALSLGNITPTSVTTTNNITMGGTAASTRFLADWTTAAGSGRAVIQTSTANGSTFIEAIPNGTGTAAGFQAENNSTIGNNALGSLVVTSTEVSVNSSIRGTGTPLDLILFNQGLRGLNVTTTGNVVLGGVTALATSATDRFLFLNSMAGIPSGVPTTPTGYTGKTPITVDTTNNVLYFYSGGAWRSSSGGAGTVTSVSVTTANGVSGSVATATTTPAITLTLSAITPTSVAASGTVTGSNLSGTNTGDQTITLTGGVTGSGTGSFAATVVTNANLTGDVTSVGNATTLTNAPVIAKVLTGYTSGAGTVSATDSILQAIQKLNGNDATNANLTGMVTSVGNATTVVTNANLTGDVTSVGNATTLANTAVTPGSYTNTSITVDAKGRITAASNGSAGGVTSFNTRTGAVTLTSGDVTTALGFTPGTGTVTSTSVVTANGVSGSVATATTTPAITLTLGAITPSSVASVGTVTGSNLSGTNTGDQTITLTGGVTGSGTGSFAATVVTNANLTGDVTSVGNASTLANTAVTPGAYTYASITVDSKGRLTAASSGAAPTGTVTSVTVNGSAGRITSTGSPITTTGSITMDLDTVAVTPGSYTNTNITVDAYGRVTSAANGSPGGVTSVSASAPLASTGGATPDISITQAGVATDGYLSTTDWNTFNNKGSGSVTSVGVSSSGTITVGSSPITTSGTITVNLANTAVTPGAYTSADITVDAQGRVTSAVNGSGGGGGAVVPNYEEFVATASQTVFNTTMTTTAKAAGKAYLQVYVNGVFQMEGAGKAYTVTGANQITFNTGVTLNNDVVIYGLTATNYEEFVSTTAQTVFNTAITTTAKAAGKAYLQVYVNGVFQMEGAGKAYTVTGTNQITFNTGVTLNNDVVLYGYNI